MATIAEIDALERAGQLTPETAAAARAQLASAPVGDGYGLGSAARDIIGAIGPDTATRAAQDAGVARTMATVGASMGQVPGTAILRAPQPAEPTLPLPPSMSPDPAVRAAAAPAAVPAAIAAEPPAPEAVPQMAPAMPRPGGGGGGISRAEKAARKDLLASFDAAAGAVHGGADVAQQGADETSDVMRRQRADVAAEELEQRSQRARDQALIDERTRQYERDMNEATSRRLEPGRALSLRSNFSQATTALIGSLLGAVGSAIAGTENTGLKVLDGVIDRDIRQQESEIDNLRARAGKSANLIAEARRKYGDNEQAREVVRGQLLASYQAQLVEARERMKGPEARAAADAQLAEIGQRRAQTMLSLAQRDQARADAAAAARARAQTGPSLKDRVYASDVLETDLRGQPVTKDTPPQMMTPDQRKRRVAGYGLARTPELATAAAKALAARGHLLKQVAKLRELRRVHGQEWFRTHASATARSVAANMLINQKEIDNMGQLSGADVGLENVQIPEDITNGFWTDNALSGLDTYEQSLRYATTAALQAAGLDVAGDVAGAAPPTAARK